ncbi:hypothetical protein ACJX0J_006053, partial [Zea mays]
DSQFAERDLVNNLYKFVLEHSLSQKIKDTGIFHNQKVSVLQNLQIREGNSHRVYILQYRFYRNCLSNIFFGGPIENVSNARKKSNEGHAKGSKLIQDNIGMYF